MPSETSPAFRNPEGALYHGIPIAYAVLAYAIGIAGLFQESRITVASIFWNWKKYYKIS